VQTTADGVLVVLHDDTLDRTARGPADSCTGPVTAKTLRQIETCDVGSWFNEAHPDRANPKFVGLRIPTMEQILRRYGSQARYYAEIKSPAAQPGIEQKLIDLFERSGALARPASDHAIVVQSFSAESLQRVHALRPDIPLVQLVPIRADAAALDGYRAYAAGIGPSSETVDAALVQAAHERCLAVHPYTVDDPAEMTRLLGIGIDGLFTDVPDRFAAAREASSPAARPAGCGENGLLTGR
jgi:glycerophosphoryl diester phosphodiesterase